jgi:PEP-CTERM motif
MKRKRSRAWSAALVRVATESWTMKNRLAPLGALCVLCAIPAAANTINLSTTAANTAGYTISVDTNCVAGNPPGCSGGATEGTTVTAVTDAGALWDVANSTVSDGTTSNGVWIAPLAVQDGPSGNGQTVYDVTFVLPTGFTGITLSLNLAADDYVTVVLNPSGSDTTVFAPSTSQKTNGMWNTASGVDNFTTAAAFAVGLNTLQFTVPNNSSDTTTSCCGPTGLLVDADVTFTSSAPEPGTLALIGTGLLAVGASFRRRKQK